MKIKKALFASCIFSTFLLTFYLFHIQYLQINVIFYSAMLDGVLAAIFASVVLFNIKSFNLFNRFEKIQMTVIWILVGYVFAISIPTVIDRSLSFYILEKLDQRGGGIQLTSFEEVFTKEYVKEYRLVDVRLTEQQASGTIIIQNGCVKLTERGKRLAKFSGYFRKHFLSKQRLLMGEYTDSLTDPFRLKQNMHDEDVPNYQCN